MTDEQVQEERQSLSFTDQELFLKIWSRPRLVFQYLTETKHDKYLTVLLILAGISSAFTQASNRNSGDSLSLLAVVAICIFVGGLFGWISYYIYAALLSWTGKWLNGQGDTDAILRLIAYAMIPSIVALLLFIPNILIFGNETFQSSLELSGRGFVPIFVYYLSAFLEVMLGVWTIVLLVIGISAVQQLSILKAILNLLLPGLIIVVPLVIIAFLLGDFFKP